jgi:hypothetical protein
MGYQLSDGTKLPLDVAFTTPDGVQRPANFLRLSTERDRELLGITWVADTSNSYDQKFYWDSSTPKQLDDVTDDDGNTTTGLKTLWKAKQNEIAASLLAPSDWRVVKELEVNSSFASARTAYPSAWMTYRAAVRTACNTRQSEIDACSDVAALKDLLYGDAKIIRTRQQQVTDDEGNGLVDDDGNPIMEAVNDLDDDGNIVMIANPNVATPWPDPVE